MDALPGLWSLTPIGGIVGVIVVLYWLLATGRLITRSSHERELAQSNKRGDEWKETALDGRKTISAQSSQITMLTQANQITEHLFRTANPQLMGDTIPQGGGPVGSQ